MQKSEEPNLFLRKQNDSEEDGEEWDDSEIIAAYDKAVSAAKRKLTRKIQKELGLKDEDVEEFLSEAGSSSSRSKKNGKNKKKKNKKRKWKVGSSCRAVYSQDGEEYEAVIVKIIDGHWCIVRFVGYENEEEVLLEDLTPSLGKSVVQAQMEAAHNSPDEVSGDQQQDEVPYVEVKSEFAPEEIPRHFDEQTRMFGPSIRRFPMMFPFPPPPPPPPPTRMTKVEDPMRRQEDINAMLMSWYMCGYYTGLYDRGLELEKK